MPVLAGIFLFELNSHTCRTSFALQATGILQEAAAITMATTLQAAVQPHLPLQAPYGGLMYLLLMQIRRFL